MKLPSGITEEEFLTAFNASIGNLAKQFSFPGYTHEDMRQEAFILAAEGVFAFKPELGIPLDKFLHIHLHNRLFNFKRNNFIRHETSCGECKRTGEICQRCKTMKKRNINKLKILAPGTIDDDNPYAAYENSLEYIELVDYVERLEQLMPKSMYEDFLRLKDGASIPTKRKQNIKDFIRDSVELQDW